MVPKHFCQSCSMPIDNAADKGTEKNGTKSEDYCKYCYANGSFINPSLTLEAMKSVVETQMRKRHIPFITIEQSLALLPYLKRWQPVSPD